MNRFTKYKGKLVAVGSTIAGGALAAQSALAAGGTDYSALSDAVEGEWTAGKPTLMAIFGVILAIAAVFVLYRRAKSAAR